ncbi:O-unit flippase-like protein [Sphingobacterium multivorum]|uniref:O-unit flippase-like protein n=1 Tax=Sphingobacterium multivorum TaxID=28454 RepID=UPI0028B1927C|nr:O-unit flippase-like protein [Sphingobacterium multivorum]
MNINKVDVIWNYMAVILKMGSSIFLLPIILKSLGSDDVGIWMVFSTITGLVYLMDFGFHASFVRVVSYIWSGAQDLEVKGFSKEQHTLGENVNFGLLKGVIKSMRWFYSRVSVILFLLLASAGTAYLYDLISNYSGGKAEIMIAWGLFCLVTCYNLFTLYYEALLEGSGKIRVIKRISIIGNILYIACAWVLIKLGYGLLAIVVAQLISVFTIRVFMNRAFYTPENKPLLDQAISTDRKYILSKISPNAVKYGITSLGGFLIQKSSLIIGAMYVPLHLIGSFGISKQIVDLMIMGSNIILSTYLPKISALRLKDNKDEIRHIVIWGLLVSNILFITGSILFIFLGPSILNLIGSKTSLLDQKLLACMAISAFLGLNSGISGAIISTKNEIPFMVPSIISGVATILLLFVGLGIFHWGMIVLVLAPGLVDLCYQAWKWPLMVFKDFNINFSTCKQVLLKGRLR